MITTHSKWSAPMTPLYTANAIAEGGRNGQVHTDDGLLKFSLSIPKSMGGPGAEGATNPEQLFACGYAACFSSAVDFVARMQKIPLTGVQVVADVTINKIETGFALSVVLNCTTQGLQQAAAEALIAAAHQVCPYSNATRNNVPVQLIVSAT
jgi:Ohr subfamily peroxiredoxin